MSATTRTEQCDKTHRDLISLALWIGTLLLFLKVIAFDFLLYDDPHYVFENPHVVTGVTKANVKWAVTSLNGDTSYWHPLTWWSHQIDCQLFGLAAGAHHFTNVLIHSFAGMLLFLFLNDTTRKPWRSGMVAAIFCLHPMHVESIAWVAERKDVLSGFCWMLTLLAYKRYVDRRTFMRYLLVCLTYGFAIMSKPSVVTLPFVLMLLDFWPFGRLYNLPLDARLRLLRSIVLEKTPLLIMAAVASTAAYKAQADLGALSTLASLPFSDRILNAVMSYALYVGKFFLPVHQSIVYTTAYTSNLRAVAAAAIVLCVITAASIRIRLSRPYILVGWLWFLGTLVPMIGIVQAGAQTMADRYTYLPYIGVALSAVWATADACERFSKTRVISGCIAAMAIGVMVITTGHYLNAWESSLKVFQYAVSETNNNWLAHHNYALALVNGHRFSEAEAQFGAALKITPRNPTVACSYGEALMAAGETRRGLDWLLKAFSMSPKHLGTVEGLAHIYASAEENDIRDGNLALNYARLAMQLTRHRKPKHLELLAAAYAELGRFDDAMRAQNAAAELSSVINGSRDPYAERLDLYRAKKPYRDKIGLRARRLPSVRDLHTAGQ